jgi:putative SOS response-associated peptidase YedK
MPDWNITSDSMQPFSRLCKDTGERELAFLKWRLVPFWSKTPKPTFESINARADKLLNNGSWREPFQRRRCLNPANPSMSGSRSTRKRSGPVR